MKIIKKFFLLILFIAVLFALAPNLASAGLISQSVSSFGAQVYGGAPMPPQQLAALIIGTVLMLLGIIFVALIIYGGFIIMTATGEPEKVKKGKNIIIYSVIGLIIIIAAYAIASFVITLIINSSGANVITTGNQLQTNPQP